MEIIEMLTILQDITEYSSRRIKDKEKASVFYTIYSNPGITRKELIYKLNIRPIGVSSYVGEMISQRLIYEDGKRTLNKKGRPEIRLYTNYNRIAVISVYAVSNQIKALLINSKQEILMEKTAEASSNITSRKFLSVIFSLISSLKDSCPPETLVIGAGIVTEGIVNSSTLTLQQSHVWEYVNNISLKSLSQKLSLQISLVSAECAYLEYLLMNSPEHRHSRTLFFQWSHNIGASYAVNGKRIDFNNGSAMDLGYIRHIHAEGKPAQANSVNSLQYQKDILPSQLADKDNNFLETLRINFLPDAVLRLLTIYRILTPDNIIICSPFFKDDSIQSNFISQFHAASTNPNITGSESESKKTPETVGNLGRPTVTPYDNPHASIGSTYDFFRKTFEYLLKAT